MQGTNHDFRVKRQATLISRVQPKPPLLVSVEIENEYYSSISAETETFMGIVKR